MADTTWQRVGSVQELKQEPLQQIQIGKTKIALSYIQGRFHAVSGVCNHIGGPLGEGRLEGDYLVCPWHHWKFHHATGIGEPGYEQDAVPVYPVKIEGDDLWVSTEATTQRAAVPLINRIRSHEK